MTRRHRIGGGLLLLVMALVAADGCGGVQDADQPAAGSISVPAKRDDDDTTGLAKGARAKPVRP
jgi:hypothetical protein